MESSMKATQARRVEHLAQAEQEWLRIRGDPRALDGAPPAIRRQVVDEARQRAATTYWLYPLIEARAGLPA